jgi:hypothetical protein
METLASKERWRGRLMLCKSCGSEKQRKFTAEIAIHFPGRKNLEMPPIWVFPDIIVCLGCGTSLFVIPEAELTKMLQGISEAQ